MNGYRRSAVSLHALPAAERDFILNQLPLADQSMLRALLDELQTLGFESDTGVSDQATGIDLTSASAAAMFELLEHEPVALVAHVLAAQSWRWGDDVLARFSSVRRQAIRRAAIRPAPACTRAVLASLHDRLATVSAGPGTVTKQHAAPWRQFKRWIASWR